MHKLLKQAFTLIELLVVIAIIGILSGLIIIGMNGMTQSANIAKSQVFSNSLRNSLMMNLISEWKFDGTGKNDGDTADATYTQDSWSGGNTCSIVGTPKVKTGSNCINGSCLSFNGSTDYLNCGTGVSIGLNSFTFTFWAKTTINNASQTVIYRAAAVTGWEGKFNLPQSPTMNALFYVTNGNLGDIYSYMSPSSSSSNTTDGKWHYFVGTCNRSQHLLTAVYLDGKLTSSPSAGYCDQLTTNIPSGTLYIGSGGAINYFNGLVDEVRIYNAAIPTSQIKEQYYAGLNRLLTNEGITNEEYQDRIGELAIVQP